MSHRQLLTGADVRELFTAVLPDAALDGFIQETGFQERERRLDAKRFLRSTVIAAAAGSGRDGLAILFSDSEGWTGI